MRPAVERVDVVSALDLRARRAFRGLPTDAKEVVDDSVVLATRPLGTREEEEARLVFVADVVRAAAVRVAAGLSAFTALVALLALLA